MEYFNHKNFLKRSFFDRPTLTVAEELLGKILVFNNHYGIISETEAYIGFEDEASHAYRGKTKRTEIMFGRPGYSYVYFIYGMYYCLNIVTEKEEFPAAVLIRGLWLIDNNGNILNKTLLNGPGKICRYLGIDRSHNGIDMCSSKILYVTTTKKSLKTKHQITPRIGIRVAKDKPWRFLLKDICEKR